MTPTLHFVSNNRKIFYKSVLELLKCAEENLQIFLDSKIIGISLEIVKQILIFMSASSSV